MPPPGIIFGIVIVVIVVALVVVVIFTGGQRTSTVPTDTSAIAPDGKLDLGERASSIVSEQIEEMVREKLKKYADLANISLDFGAADDGTIDVWVNDVQYDDPQAIPDERIRAAVKEAVAEFNKA